MKTSTWVVAASFTAFATVSSAQWGGMSPFGSSGSNMMPWGGQGYSQPQYSQQPFGSMMPWGQNQAPVYQAPQNNGFSNMMPWGNSAPRYQAPPSNSFSQMMPWGGGSQQRYYQQPQSQNFMMPGMEQGIRSMMQPGRIMAEEATPGMYMKPTWR